MKNFVTVPWLCMLATGCVFFDEPLTDAPAPVPTSVPASPAGSQNTANEPASTSAPTPVAAAADTTAARSPSYLVVAPIERFPDDATNIAVVHLTTRSTSRDLALCKALMSNSPAVDVQDIPPEPLTVIVWPVPNDNAGATCIEMISDYEAIDVTAEAAQKMRNDAIGPFLLTRHLPSGKRMVYDMSFINNSALSSTVNRWLTLLGSDPSNWPAYRRAQ